MPFITVALFAVVIVALLSRDHDLSVSQETVVSAELNLDDSMLSMFPEHIRLSRCSFGTLARPHDVRRAQEALRVEGFDDAGHYAIDELPGVCVAFMVNRRDHMFAVLYDHARAGVWAEIDSRYHDGSRWIHSTLASPNCPARPGTTLIAVPGVTVAELLARARGDRPQDGLRPIHRLDVAPVFEQGYADWIAWRRSRVARPELRLVQGGREDEDVRKAA